MRALLKPAIAILLAAPLVVLATEAVVANIRFEEIGEKAGVRALHHTHHFSGAHADVLRMFTSGGASVAIGDYDGDGLDDLFVTDSDAGHTSHLFHNDGNLKFTDVTEKAGVGGGNDAHNIVADALWFDYDNDG